jgi:hypothetical protein
MLTVFCFICKMKPKIILFLLFSISANAQLAKPFFGFGLGYNTQFQNKGFGNISSGVEFSFLKYVKPELEIGFFFGNAHEDERRDNQYNVTNSFDASFSSLNFSFSPKIIWKQEEEDTYFFQIMPKYSVARVEAIGNYYNISQNNNTISLAERQVLKEVKHTFAVGVGICFNVSGENIDAIALNLYYSNNNFGGLLNDLKHNSRRKNKFQFRNS